MKPEQLSPAVLQGTGRAGHRESRELLSTALAPSPPWDHRGRGSRPTAEVTGARETALQFLLSLPKTQGKGRSKAKANQQGEATNLTAPTTLASVSQTEALRLGRPASFSTSNILPVTDFAFQNPWENIIFNLNHLFQNFKQYSLTSVHISFTLLY